MGRAGRGTGRQPMTDKTAMESSNPQCESCTAPEAALKGMTDTAVEQDKEIARLRAELGYIGRLCPDPVWSNRAREALRGAVQPVETSEELRRCGACGCMKLVRAPDKTTAAP